MGRVNVATVAVILRQLVLILVQALRNRGLQKENIRVKKEQGQSLRIENSKQHALKIKKKT